MLVCFGYTLWIGRVGIGMEYGTLINYLEPLNTAATGTGKLRRQQRSISLRQKSYRFGKGPEPVLI
jgi:hypothetical protein